MFDAGVMDAAAAALGGAADAESAEPGDATAPPALRCADGGETCRDAQQTGAASAALSCAESGNSAAAPAAPQGEDERRVLRLCVEVGRTLLESGGEIGRVQETVLRIARAMGAEDFHVYVLTNGLFASTTPRGGEQQTCEIRHVPDSFVHLGRVVAVNALSRDIEARRVKTPAEAMARLEEIRALPCTPPAGRVAACGIGAACFCYLFGGSALDAAAALAVGIVLQCFLFLLERRPKGKIIYNILAAAAVALCSFGAAQGLGALGLAAHLDKIIIGGIIPLVPGVPLTTSIRDFAGGDYLSGTIRMIDALLVAGSIAIGVGAVLVVLSYVPEVIL